MGLYFWQLDKVTNSETSVIMSTIIIAGDLCPKNRVASLFDEGKYEDVLSEVKPKIVSADYSMVNLEAPIVNGKGTPILKAGPNLKCSNKVIGAIKYAGFKGVTLANNHFRDYGEDGVLNTLKELHNKGVDFVGAGKNLLDAAFTKFLKIKEDTIAIINCCEHEYSIATKKSAGSNPLIPIDQYYAIQEARSKAKRVFVVVHGGIEHYQLPTPRMVKTYRFFIDAGADAVINHHQHCYSGYEIYNNKPIFYGLGNFCFDWNGKRNSNWNYGYLIKIDTETLAFEIIPYRQCDEQPNIRILDGEEKEGLFKKLDELNEIIRNTDALEENLYKLSTKNTRGFDPFHPYTNSYLCGLYRRGLLPSFVSKKKLMAIQNKIECESHLERLSYVIQYNLK